MVPPSVAVGQVREDASALLELDQLLENLSGRKCEELRKGVCVRGSGEVGVMNRMHPLSLSSKIRWKTCVGVRDVDKCGVGSLVPEHLDYLGGIVVKQHGE